MHLRVDVLFTTQTQYQSLQTPWLVLESGKRNTSSYFGLISWMYLHLRVDVLFTTRTQYYSLQTSSRYLLNH
ncbi:unnamed protein product [Schistosoma margrebowiei]|uniref:Uncharacterized protein n=1 Tax=Schistosoma margrebowiei TaxID=48269 RepID=A0A3P8B0F0_9TREM|nr:unnamed protein product [Schistosoma margrebowiei]